MTDGKHIAIYYEHPEWFKPLFAELERRNIAYERLLAHEHTFDPSERFSPYALVFNRTSPSAYTRGHTNAIFYALQYLAYMKSIGAKVVNGYEAFHLETSKALQLDLFERLELRYPRARVINHPSQAANAAHDLTFPVVIKPNIGGSGAKIRRFDSLDELITAGDLDLGIDQTALIQEYLPTRNGHIVRVEILNGEFLYAIKVFPKPEEGFNLCPADICQPANVQPAPLSTEACPVDAVPKLGLKVEGTTPPPAVIENVKRIMRAAHIDVGGVEYLVNDRDGEAYYYDVNALSNFVSDAPNVVGFDPFPRLVDYLLERAGIRERELVTA
jgi:ribosomal protein S6-L-glutamate ligase RimK-like protein